MLAARKQIIIPTIQNNLVRGCLERPYHTRPVKDKPSNTKKAISPGQETAMGTTAMDTDILEPVTNEDINRVKHKAKIKTTKI